MIIKEFICPNCGETVYCDEFTKYYTVLSRFIYSYNLKYTCKKCRGTFEFSGLPKSLNLLVKDDEECYEEGELYEN